MLDSPFGSNSHQSRPLPARSAEALISAVSAFVAIFATPAWFELAWPHLRALVVTSYGDAWVSVAYVAAFLTGLIATFQLCRLSLFLLFSLLVVAAGRHASSLGGLSWAF